MATITKDNSTVIEEETIRHEDSPKHLEANGHTERRHLQWDRTFVTRPSTPEGTVNAEERSLLITFIAFAIIVAISMLAVMAMVNEGGSGSVTTFAEGMQTAITPNVQT